MNIGHRALIAAFAQEAVSWYPDHRPTGCSIVRAATKLASAQGVAPAEASDPERENRHTDKEHRFFAGCQSVLVNSGGVDLQLSASNKPLPLQYEPQQARSRPLSLGPL